MCETKRILQIKDEMKCLTYVNPWGLRKGREKSNEYLGTSHNLPHTLRNFSKMQT